MDLRLVGLASIALTWVFLAVVIRKWKGDISMTLSQHAAQTRAGCIFYFLAFMIVLPPFYVFMIEWFAPEFLMSNIFVALVSLGVAAQIGAVLIPETTGWKVPVHRFLAFTMAFILFPTTFLIAINQYVPLGARLVAWLALLFMAYTQINYNLNKSVHKYFLAFQMAYVAFFHVTVIAATVL